MPGEIAKCNVTNTYISNNLKIEKTSNQSYFTKSGDKLDYLYKVTNLGNYDISDLKVFDNKILDIKCPKVALIVNESVVCNGEYFVTQDDVKTKALLMLPMQQLSL